MDLPKINGWTVRGAGLQVLWKGTRSWSSGGWPDSAALRSETVITNIIKGAVDGNKVHVKMSVEIDKVQPSLAEIVVTPLGEYLWALGKAGRYVPVRDACLPSGAHTRAALDV
jgi:hypothetical protein